MLEYRKCYPEHIKCMDLQGNDYDEIRAFLAPETAEFVFKQGVAMSAWEGFKPIAAAGLIPYYPGLRSIAWAVFSPAAGKHMTDITRKTLAFLREDKTPRIEMHVLSDFSAGHRWAKMLGFTCETPDGMKGFSPTGKTQHMYALVR